MMRRSGVLVMVIVMLVWYAAGIATGWQLRGERCEAKMTQDLAAVDAIAAGLALLAEIRDELRRIGGVMKYPPLHIVRYEPGDPHREPSVVYGGPDV